MPDPTNSAPPAVGHGCDGDAAAEGPFTWVWRCSRTDPPEPHVVVLCYTRGLGCWVGAVDPDGYWSHWVGGAERPLAWAELPDPPVTT